MVRYYLICINEHTFDCWFKNIKFFEQQMQNKGSITCPICNSEDICKQIIAPNLVKQNSNSDININSSNITDVEKVRMYLNNLNDYVKSNFNYVGTDFKDLAIDMHKEKIKKENIYGEITLNDAEELTEEGVDIFPIGLKTPTKKIN